MAKTTNLQLNKPLISDVFELEKFNENADILDTEVQSVKDRTTSLETGQDTLDSFKVSQETLNSTLVKGDGESIQIGNTSVVFTDSFSGSITIPFTDTFLDTNYTVFATPTSTMNGLACVCYRVTRSTTTMTIYFMTVSQTPSSGTLGITWCAIGKLA